MIHPSYADLMEVVNSNVEEGEQPVVQSRYSIVLATSKRAREIIAGDDPLIENVEGVKPLSIAVEELYQGKIKILSEDEEETVQDIVEVSEETDDGTNDEISNEMSDETDDAISEETDDEMSGDAPEK